VDEGYFFVEGVAKACEGVSEEKGGMSLDARSLQDKLVILDARINLLDAKMSRIENIIEGWIRAAKKKVTEEEKEDGMQKG
jgi:hypothetical protein